MHWLSRALRVVDAISDWSGKIPSYMIVGMFVILAIEVTLRYAFNSPTNWAHETTQILFGAYLTFGGAYCLRWKSHINMDLFYSRWSPRTRAIVDLITSLIFFFFCGVLIYSGMNFGWQAVLRLEHSHTAWGPPVYPLKMCIPVAAILLLLQGVAKFTRDLAVVVRGTEL
jgi:TRAP-type mannitol/chloroaromatic compound transport system permease small subunit